MPASAPPSISPAFAWLARMKAFAGFPVVQLPDTVLDGLLGVFDHRLRGRCPLPLPGTGVLDLRLPINGS
jgi:hypothetical protein